MADWPTYTAVILMSTPEEQKKVAEAIKLLNSLQKNDSHSGPSRNSDEPSSSGLNGKSRALAIM